MPAIDFNKEPCIYWSPITKINYLQRRIIIYSLMYYEFNESCVSDDFYNRLATQLISLQETHTDVLSKTVYFYIFKYFKGGTGFNISHILNKYDKEYLTELTSNIYNQWQKAGGKIIK